MSQLLEEILSKDNMTQAYKKVKANKGTCGADGVGMDEIDDYLRKNWKTIKEEIRNRKFNLPCHTSQSQAACLVSEQSRMFGDGCEDRHERTVS